MCHVLGAMLIGAAAGNLAGNTTRRRPIFRSVIKTGIAAKRQIEAVSAKVVAESRKLVDEARADLDSAQTETQS
ncbi:MAG: hypothetical protein JOZ22_09505 [Acidobacteriia bacterium]|nr:hypothetical protein [Terriglobia bacterium]